MNKHLFPSISIEKIAAYMDNNLSEAEMQEVGSVLKDDKYSPLYEELASFGDDALTNQVDLDNSEIEALDTLSVPDLHDCDVEPIASFVDDFFIDDVHDDTAINSENDSIMEHNTDDDF